MKTYGVCSFCGGQIIDGHSARQRAMLEKVRTKKRYCSEACRQKAHAAAAAAFGGEKA